MADYQFPPEGLPEPKIPSATNAGDSYKKVLSDSTITTTTDAHYKRTRPRTTRVIRSWSYSWVALSEEEYALLEAFWLAVRTSETFSFKNYMDGRIYAVRFTGDYQFIWDPSSNGYRGTLTFEEV